MHYSKKDNLLLLALTVFWKEFGKEFSAIFALHAGMPANLAETIKIKKA